MSRNTCRLFLAAALCAGASTACAPGATSDQPPLGSGSAGDLGPLPQLSVNHAVPRLFSRNLGPNCALISLQMVLAYQGIQTTLGELEAQLPGRAPGGAVRFSDLVDIAYRYPVRVFYVNEPSTTHLRALVAAEFAPLVAGRPYGPDSGHARVLVGYTGTDDENGTFYLLDPNSPRTVQESVRRYVAQARPFAVLVLDETYTRDEVIRRLTPFFSEGEALPQIRHLERP